MMGSTIGKTMDSLLPPDWGKANYRDKVSGKQVEYYYYNRKSPILLGSSSSQFFFIQE
jgi:hypothetical protein